MDISGSACRQTEGEVMQSRGRDGWKMELILLLPLSCHPLPTFFHPPLLSFFLPAYILSVTCLEDTADVSLSLEVSGRLCCHIFPPYRGTVSHTDCKRGMNHTCTPRWFWVGEWCVHVWVGVVGGVIMFCSSKSHVSWVLYTNAYARWCHLVSEQCSELCCEYRRSSWLLVTRLGPTPFVWTWPLPKPITGWCTGDSPTT